MNIPIFMNNVIREFRTKKTAEKWKHRYNVNCKIVKEVKSSFGDLRPGPYFKLRMED